MAILKRREFFRLVRDETLSQLPPEMGEPHTRATLNLLKVHYQPNYRVHYEVMISAQNSVLEIGLHFEDGPESSTRLLEHFDRHILEIKHELGEQVELERWTKSWGHLFEVHELEPLTSSYGRQVAARLSRYIHTLEPMLEAAYEEGLVSREPRPSTGGRRFGRRRR